MTNPREVLDGIEDRAELGTAKHWRGPVETYGAIGAATDSVTDDVPRLVAALRAVLDLCDEAAACCTDRIRFARVADYPRDIRSAITEALTS